jgi:two-component system, OmpR family, sensor histidine kinase MtrB
MRKRRPQLSPLADQMVSWAKDQRGVNAKLQRSTESQVDDPQIPGADQTIEVPEFRSQPDILDLLEGNGLIDEDLDELPARIDQAGSVPPDQPPGEMNSNKYKNSTISIDGQTVRSRKPEVAEGSSLDPETPMPDRAQENNQTGEVRKTISKPERKARNRGPAKERRGGADRRNVALTVVPGLAPTRSKRMGPGRVFDQEAPGLSLPERYENPDPSASGIQPVWHLPAPFDRVRLGLRARATLALALGSLFISVLVSTLTFLVARTSFVDAQRTAAVKVVNTHVEAVQSAYGKGANVRLVLINQDAQAILVTVDGKRISNKLLLEDVPKALQTLLDSKAVAGSQIVETSEGKRLFVGIKLPGLDGAKFFERTGLGDVERNVNILGRTLALVTALSTIGAALVGRSVARQVVRPLRNVADAAAEISSGRLDTRLPRSGDVDLDPLLASFNNMAATLQQRVEREGRFASDVSHELRTPLTALSTAAQLLQGRREEFSERSQRAVDVLVSQTQHFERLVLDLLEISRFDAGAAEIHREVLHLPEFVRLVVAINSPFVDGDGARVEIPVDDSEMIYPEVSLDKRRVERVVANLLQNAANYGGGAVRVSLADVIENDQPYVRIAVDDDGPGVPDAEKTAIFERFARGQATKGNANSPKGTGLGLALVSAHVALHDGRVWVEDRENGGARFVALFAVEERVAPDAEDVA